ncbi:pyridoxamine 5'-phosphate oxidase family protein [Desulfatitalea alkaliphila]|uniref:Pyridoxamine 5'-phosphate oxidase family protein n=1 Tax=Desulfatitalea alkaliphila TaxID=2929485 RepID=A0AA41RAI8_9BACT|nr:pyridoxamine 5'-phosphate oxidase family protein [Desulfatitalea alkaliphila]MCJ8501638.1 pyridoxamine 5'-phosphate oxidase family protein [Desulfatitalea alkaliphila]
MAKMTERMQELFKKVPAAVLCTATNDGSPNGVPVGAKRLIDAETVLISDQFLNKTLANMKSNPRVALTFWEGHEGYQLKGTVTIETTGPRFEETSRWIEERSTQSGNPLKCKGVVILKIDEIYGVAPGPGAGKKLS